MWIREVLNGTSHETPVQAKVVFKATSNGKLGCRASGHLAVCMASEFGKSARHLSLSTPHQLTEGDLAHFSDRAPIGSEVSRIAA